MHSIKFLLLIWLGKSVAAASRLFNLGAGSTWPGHLALESDKRILPWLVGQLKGGVILIAGTNGKTTTAKMIKTILESGIRNLESVKIVHNEAGANLLNGITSSLIAASDWKGKIKKDFGTFEVDENTLPLVLEEITPKIVVVLNLFRDQLDRYGEVDLIAEKWQKALSTLPPSSQVILNGDDPQVALLGENLRAKVSYFGLEDPTIFLKEKQHAMDVVHCLECGGKLEFSGIYFSHLGKWRCPKCKIQRPKLDLTYWDWPLPGVYNRYNTLAAVLVGKTLGIGEDQIKKALGDFEPAFGRQEEFTVDGKKVKILLSKNPTGFNESIRTLGEDRQKKIVTLVLNDRIPDGRDVSWIWDVDFEPLNEMANYIIVSGLRAHDMALQLKYARKTQNSKLKTRAVAVPPAKPLATHGKAAMARRRQNYNSKVKIKKNLKEAINDGLKAVKRGEMLYILPTYSAMLEVRKILTGRKIL